VAKTDRGISRSLIAAGSCAPPPGRVSRWIGRPTCFSPGLRPPASAAAPTGGRLPAGRAFAGAPPGNAEVLVAAW